ncbi:MAG TPA: universal stress protein [Miltoncostaeaceae bacterium]|nr:universal stress protein [Miltoncostaeaceae bacterium]
MLVAYDGTEGAEAALDAAARFAAAPGARLTVLRVLNPRTDAHQVVADTTQEALAQVEAAARSRIDDRLAALDRAAEVREEIQRRGEDSAACIARVAREEAVDVVAIGSRRAGGLFGALLGSVTSAVISHSPCPVLVVRPDQPAQPPPA